MRILPNIMRDSIMVLHSELLVVIAHFWPHSERIMAMRTNKPRMDLVRKLKTQTVYCASAIISRGLYTFYPILEDHFFVFKEGFSENYVFMYG